MCYELNSMSKESFTKYITFSSTLKKIQYNSFNNYLH